jgi:hypothetical protein
MKVLNFYRETFKIPYPTNLHSVILDLVSPDPANPTNQTLTKRDPVMECFIAVAALLRFPTVESSTLTGCGTTPKEEGASSNLLPTSQDKNPGSETSR